MNNLYIGDLHGRKDLLDLVLEKFLDTHNLYFVGDYLDSFNETIEDQVECVMRVMHLVEERPEQVVAIMGNHDYYYAHGDLIGSGFNRVTDAALLPHRTMMRKTLSFYDYDSENKILVSHAGLTKLIWDRYKMTLDTLEANLDALLVDKFSPLYWIGRARYGMKPTGGILWNDWFEEFKPIPELIQIVGHSGYKPGGVHKKGNSYNVDCLSHVRQVLEFDTTTKEFKTIII